MTQLFSYKWQFFLFSAITCPPPPIPKFAKLSVYKPLAGNNSFYGSKAVFECLPHHAMFGSDTVTCTEHGNWTQLPECRGKCDETAKQSWECRVSLLKRTADSALPEGSEWPCLPWPLLWAWAWGYRVMETWLLAQGAERRRSGQSGAAWESSWEEDARVEWGTVQTRHRMQGSWGGAGEERGLRMDSGMSQWGCWRDARIKLGSPERSGLPWWLSGKESACDAGDLGSIPGSGRSPGEGNGHPLQYSCLRHPMDRGAWRATVHGVAKSQTWVSN